MDPFLTVIFLLFGLPQAIWPYKFARFSEQMDSIGSKRSWATVEPADWKVTLTRVIGVVIALLGVTGLFIG